MNKVILRIASELGKYSEIRFKQGDSSITVFPANENGFPVVLNVKNGGFIVFFKGWHEEFADENEAVKCFMFGLSENCRLTVLSAGAFEFKWIMEYKKNTEWIKDSETGFLIFPFWRKRNTKFYQNNMKNIDVVANHK